MKTKRPVRFFNKTGPCFPWDHYMLPLEDRLVGAQLNRYIEDKLYWVLHAPRQTGTTTFLINWMNEINAGNEAMACYTSVEVCQGITTLPEAMKTMHRVICGKAEVWGLPIPQLPLENPETLFYDTMQRWAELVAPKPLIVFIDEVDVLEGEVLSSFLKQLRDGFAKRGIGKFPVSIAIASRKDSKKYIIDTKGMVFNELFFFSENDIEKLFAQRTEETRQTINRDALEYVYEQTQGEPWLVNSLLERATMRVLRADDYSPVTLAHIKEAREQMILAEETNPYSLVYWLRDPRIRKFMGTLFAGGSDPDLTGSEAFRICMDLGLIRQEKGMPVVANPMYREVLARYLTFGPQCAIPEIEWQWEKPDGSLDMDALLKEFQKFWREHSEVWEEKMSYTEAFPHLLLMAFLQRVLNGGGHIEREYAAGRGRMDLAVEYNNKIFIIEIKLIHSYDSPAEVRAEGLEQIVRYRDKTDSNAPAYLVIFDRRTETKEKPWDERLSWNEENNITIVGC